MMFTSNSRRAWLSRAVLSVLVGASVFAGSAPAHATAGVGAVDATSFSFNRDAVSGSFTVKPAEEALLSSQFIMGNDYTGWPLANKTAITRTAFTTTIPVAMGDQNPGERSFYGTDGSEDCQLWEYSASIKMTPSTTCINYLQISDERWVTNETDTNQVITSNATAQVTKFGKTAVTTNAAAESIATARVYKYDVASITIASGEDHLNVGLKGCVDESLVTVGEELTIVPVIKRDGSTLTAGTGYFLYGDENTDTELLTYTVPEESDPLENVIVNLDAELATTSTGTYIGSIDVKNSSNQSVLENCPTYDWSDWPTLATVTNSGPMASILYTSLPSHANMSNANPDMYRASADGFGGMFYWSYPSASDFTELDGATARLVHSTSSGANNSFNSSGFADLTTGDYGDLTVGRFSPSGDKWYASSSTGNTWSVTTGSLTGASTTTSYTAKNLSKLCPAKYSAQWMYPISAPTTNLLAELNCGKGGVSSVKIISLTATPTVVATLGLATTARPCVVPTMGVDSRASGATDKAIVFYTRTSSKDGEGYCTSTEAVVSGRQLTQIAVNGTATTARVTVNPWTNSGEPFTMTLAPGGSAGAGSWIGITDISTDMYSGTNPGWPFTITGGTVITESSSDAVTLDTGDNLGWRPQLELVKRVSDSSWLVAISSTMEFDSELLVKETVATLNPTTGVLVNGDIKVASDFGNFGNAQMGSTMSVAPGQSAYWYIVTAASGDGGFGITGWTP